jgi:hypothetical protein
MRGFLATAIAAVLWLSSCGGGSSKSRVTEINVGRETLRIGEQTAVTVSFTVESYEVGSASDPDSVEYVSLPVSVAIVIPPGLAYVDQSSYLSDDYLGDELFGDPDRDDPERIELCPDRSTLLYFDYPGGRFTSSGWQEDSDIYLRVEVQATHPEPEVIIRAEAGIALSDPCGASQASAEMATVGLRGGLD